MKMLFCICLLFFSCSGSTVPKGILSVNEMEKVIADLLKIDDYVNNYVSKDTAVNLKKKRSIFYEQVFKLHNTDRKKFYTSFKYYQQHPDIQKILFDSVLAVIDRGKKEIYQVRPIKSVNTK